MKRTALLAALLATALLPFTAARAQVSVSINTPDFGIRVGPPLHRPVYPVPVYMPAPHVVVPAPVYLPPPVYLPSPVYLPPPVYAPPPRYVPPPVVRTVVVPTVVYPHYPAYAGSRVAYGHPKHWKHKHRRGHRYH
jgi:hypothetical protein